MPHYNCAVVLGATATGKTALAVKLAQVKHGEIISADSRQVYRGLDLGTGKDLQEYGSIPYHLIDVCDLSREFTVFHFQQEVYRIFPQLIQKDALPIIAGGTGLYLDAILRGYELIPVPEDPALHPESAAAHLHAVPSIKPKIYGISFERSVLRERIRRRLIARIDAGMIEETEQIHAQGYSWERLESLGLEYRFTAQYLQGKIESKEAYIEQLYRAIGQFAKRQKTWFRRMARNGIEIEWIDGNEAAQLTATAITELEPV